MIEWIDTNAQKPNPHDRVLTESVSPLTGCKTHHVCVYLEFNDGYARTWQGSGFYFYRPEYDLIKLDNVNAWALIQPSEEGFRG